MAAAPTECSVKVSWLAVPFFSSSKKFVARRSSAAFFATDGLPRLAMMSDGCFSAAITCMSWRGSAHIHVRALAASVRGLASTSAFVFVFVAVHAL